MAKPITSSTSKPTNGNGAEAEDFSDLLFDAPADSMIVGESYLYRPGDQKLAGVFSSEKDNMGRFVNGVQAGKPHCGWMPIQGWLIQAHFRPEKAGMKAYYQYEIMLTKPGIAIDGEKLRRCKEKDLVLVKAGGNLHSLMGAAQDPRIITEVYLRPTGEFIPMKDENKQPMRRWEKRALQQSERKLVNVPKLAAYVPDDEADDFDTRRLSA